MKLTPIHMKRDINYVLNVLPEVVPRMREISPVRLGV